MGSQEGMKERKKTKKKGRKEKGGVKEENERKGGKGEKKKEKQGKKEGGRWVYGGRGAWVLRTAGPHTNNARSTRMFFSFSSSAKGQTTQTTPLIEAR